MKLYFLRHGQAENNVTRIYAGEQVLSIGLTALGFKEVEKAAESLSQCGITSIISSDFLRAVQSTEVVNNKLKLPAENIKYDSRLREIEMGVLAGTRHDSTPDDFRDNPHKYGAESYEDMYNRVCGFINEIEATENDGNVLISGHGITNDILAYCVCEGTDKPFDEEEFLRAYRKSIANATVSMIDMDFKKQFRKPQFIHGGEQKDEILDGKL